MDTPRSEATRTTFNAEATELAEKAGKSSEISTKDKYDRLLDILRRQKSGNSRLSKDELNLVARYYLADDETIKYISNSKKLNGANLTLVPIPKVFDLIKIIHLEIGHATAREHTKKIRKLLLKGIPESVVNVFKHSCPGCAVQRQARNLGKQSRKGGLTSKPILTDRPLVSWAVDLIDMQGDPDVCTVKGARYSWIMVVVDRFASHILGVTPLRSKQAAECAIAIGPTLAGFGSPLH